MCLPRWKRGTEKERRVRRKGATYPRRRMNLLFFIVESRARHCNERGRLMQWEWMGATAEFDLMEFGISSKLTLRIFDYVR